MTIATAPLRSLCQIKNGGTPSKANPAYWQGDIPWVSPKDMKSPSIVSTADHISKEAVADSATSIVPKGTILVVIRSGILAHTLPVSTVAGPTAFNQDIKALIPNEDLVEPEYLYWFVRSCAPLVLSQGVKKGATVHSLQCGVLECLQVPLPPRNEQRRIVDLLSRAEGIVRLRREAQKKAAEIIPALFIDMFGDPVRNPMGWKSFRLLDVTQDIRNGFNPSKDAFGNGVPFVTVNDLYGGLRIQASSTQLVTAAPNIINKYRLQKGDLCFVRSSVKRSGVGMVAVFDEVIDTIFGGFVIRVRLAESLVPLFACAMFQTPSVRKMIVESAGTGTITNINQPALLALPVVVPPIEQQLMFVQMLLATEKIEAQQAKATARAQAMFIALLAKAFANAADGVSNAQVSPGRPKE